MLSDSLKINEIFYSIQGESTWTGFPTVFVRTSGCHLRCTYCDTKYAYHAGKELSLDEITAEVKSHKTSFVCLTGGEPLLQKNSFKLLKELCDLGYKTSLETSGNISCVEVDDRVKCVIDIKTPDSGEKNTFNYENLKLMKNKLTEYKFVICSDADFAWAEDFIRINNFSSDHIILYSPSFANISEKWLAKKILSENSIARLQLQLHKYIWNPEQTGV